MKKMKFFDERSLNDVEKSSKAAERSKIMRSENARANFRYRLLLES